MTRNEAGVAEFAARLRARPGAAGGFIEPLAVAGRYAGRYAGAATPGGTALPQDEGDA
jgi:hypothetical protein